MSEWIWWMVLAFGLLILELLTGTFYLLVIAVALAAGGIASLAGAPFALQLVVAAVIGVIMLGTYSTFSYLLAEKNRQVLSRLEQPLQPGAIER